MEFKIDESNSGKNERKKKNVAEINARTPVNILSFSRNILALCFSSSLANSLIDATPGRTGKNFIVPFSKRI